MLWHRKVVLFYLPNILIMKTAWTIIHWFISILFFLLFIGFAFIEKEVIPALIYLLWVLLFIPKFQDKTFDKVKRYKWIFKTISFIVILFVWVLLSDIEVEKQDQTKKEIVVNNEETKIEKQEVIQKEQEYKIIESDDISIPTAKRFRIKVVMGQEKTSENLIKEISQEIINEYQDKWSNATVVYFYMHETEIDWWYTLAKAEWSPNGNWADAYLKKDYKTVYDFKKYVWEEDLKTPTEEEREITKQIRDLYYEMNNGSNFVTEKEVYQILAPKLNKTVEELEEIHTKVTFFEMWY